MITENKIDNTINKESDVKQESVDSQSLQDKKEKLQAQVKEQQDIKDNAANLRKEQLMKEIKEQQDLKEIKSLEAQLAELKKLNGVVENKEKEIVAQEIPGEIKTPESFYSTDENQNKITDSDINKMSGNLTHAEKIKFAEKILKDFAFKKNANSILKGE